MITDEFIKVTKFLEDKSLEYLLVSSSILSSIEFYSEWPNEYGYLSPFINISNSTMFTRSIIYSKSNYFKKEKILRDELPFLINNLNESTARLEIYEDKSIPNEDKFFLTIASILSSQVWLGSYNLSEKSNLLYALYSIIPKKHEADLKIKHKRNYINIPNTIETDFGIDLESYFITCLYLINVHFRDVYNQNIKANGEVCSYIESLESSPKSKILLELIILVSYLRIFMIIIISSLLIVIG